MKKGSTLFKLLTKLLSSIQDAIGNFLSLQYHSQNITLKLLYKKSYFFEVFVYKIKKEKSKHDCELIP